MSARLSAREVVKITGLPVVFASLCCLSPVILVLLGLSTVSVAASLADILYGQYKWVFRLLGLALLATSLVVYFRTKRGICTIDEAKKRRREIINISLIVLIVAVVGYIIFLYGVVEIIGIWLGLWE